MSLKRQPGFTIVELLIVIVVIAILAALSIVAYRGIQNRANSSSAQSAAHQAATKLKAAFVENETYPSSLSSVGIADSENTTYQYSVNNTASPKTYCITATTNGRSYYINNTSATSPTQGGCAGHGVGGVEAITNLTTNPSLESNMTGWSGSGMAISNIDPVSGNNYLEWNVGYLSWPSLSVVSGNTYTVTAYVKSKSPSSAWFDGIRPSQAGGGYQYSVNRAVSIGSWTRFTHTFTADFTGLLQIRCSYIGFIDAVMYTTGSTVLDYHDGSSLNWVWNAAPNNSTSTGPIF